MSNWQNGYGASKTKILPGNEPEKRKPDPYQIAFISNSRNCLAAVSCLQVADLNDWSEKSPAAIHSRYSRIRISVTDFSLMPTLYHTFYLDPAEVRRLHRQIMIHRGLKSFEYIKSKAKNKDGKRVAEVFRLDKDPYKRDYKTNKPEVDNQGKKTLATYPWKITIGKGEYVGNQKKPTMHKWTYKLLGEDELEDFFCTLVSYLNIWELTYGPQQLIAIHDIPFFHNPQDIGDDVSGENNICDGDDEPYL